LCNNLLIKLYEETAIAPNSDAMMAEEEKWDEEEICDRV
jgi:hypothetical protein